MSSTLKPAVSSSLPLSFKPLLKTMRLHVSCHIAHVALTFRRARMIEYCVQPATNLKQALYTKNAYPFGSRPCVTDCPAQRSHHIATIGDKRCVRSRWRCTWALARGIAKLGSCISAAVLMAVRLDMAALAQKLRQRHERGA